MKRYILSISLIICSLHSISQISYFKSFSLADFIIEDTLCLDHQTYAYFPFFSAATINQAGAPALPSVPVKLLIPTGSRIDSIKVVVGDTSTIWIRHLMFPYQQPIPTNCPGIRFTTIDSTIYFSNTSFPAEEFKYSTGQWYSAQIVNIDLFPFCYYPVENKLVFFKSMTIYLYYTDYSLNVSQIKMEREFYLNFIESLNSIVANPESIELNIKNIVVFDKKPPSTEEDPNMDYVVIVHNTFLNSEPLNRFINWKKKKGINIEVVDWNSLPEIPDNICPYGQPNNQYISDDAAKIRMYLKEVNDNGGCKYVLLVGDSLLVPVRRYYADHGPDVPEVTLPSYVLTDKYFADYHSDYAVDSDTKYGEYYGDNVDLNAESYIGRIPCENLEEFEIWVGKFLSYETNPGDGDASYLNRFVMTMADELQRSIEGFPIITDTYLNIFNPLSIYEEYPSYDAEYPTQPNGSDIINSLNTSPAGWWTWDNHGETYKFITRSCGINGTEYSDINSGSGSNGLYSLHNSNKFGIISSNCCHVANFSATSNMAEAVLFNPSGGAVAIAGNTDLGWYPEGQKWLYELSEAIYKTNNGTIWTNRYSTAALTWLEEIGNFEYDRYETYLTKNYFGDPEMMYYTKEPTKLMATVTPRHVTLIDDNTIEITIKNLPDNQKAMVCLFQSSLSGDYQVTEEVEGIYSGDVVVTFDIPANTLQTGKLYVTISGFNLIPFTDTILVSPNCNYNTNPITITGAEVWNFLSFLNQNVIIKPGAVLTIKGEAYFVSESRIIVEPGAKLIIDGGTLGTSCENRWHGVEVWGQRNLPQTSAYQGEVNVLNGGIIKDAIVGIKTYKGSYPGYDIINTGGIIKCSNAGFINNRIAIDYHPYANNNLPNPGYFRDCNFIWDDNYIQSNPLVTQFPDTMILLNDINTLAFTRCKLLNKMTSAQLEKQRGYGFKVSNSTISIKGDENTTNLSSIEGFYYGVYFVSYYPKYINVKNTTFTNNLRAVYCGSPFSLVSVNKNTFYTRPGTSIDFGYGLYLDNTTGYSVQDNLFHGNYYDIDTHENGIIANNTGKESNEIYNNKFKYLHYGIKAQEDNVGLVCKCNDYDTIKFDQSVMVKNFGSLGIANMQGSSGSVNAPAGNTFSSKHPSILLPESDIKNQGTPFQYLHHIQNQQGIPPRVLPVFISNSITPINTFQIYTKSTACPSKISDANRSIIIEELNQEEAQIDSLQTNLNELVDGGNTEETVTTLLLSEPNDASYLEYELLNKSPYLSDTVMSAAIEKESVLSNTSIHSILIANPHSANSQTVLDRLDQRLNPMPENLYLEILQSQNVLAPLTAEIASIQESKRNHLDHYYELIKKYMNDSINNIDSLIYLLELHHHINDIYMKSLIQLHEHDYINMNTTLTEITDEFNLNSSELILNDYYLQIFQILEILETDSLHCLKCDSVTINQLINIMNYSPEPVKSIARNILIINEQLIYNEPYQYDDNIKSSMIKKTHRMGPTRDEFLFGVYPNPSHENFIVEYNFTNLSKDNENHFLELCTINGSLIKRINLINKSGRINLSTENIESGLYIINFSSKEKIYKSIKVVLF